jgi:Na+/H+ antiporter NhaD/arsenite permease-like protein
MENTRIGWLVIAASSTLAGNLTLVGSVANLIVAETASRWRVELSFWEYTKAGLIVTLVTLLIAAFWLNLLVAWG